MTLLDIKGLTIDIARDTGPVRVVDGIDLEIPPGQSVAWASSSRTRLRDSPESKPRTAGLRQMALRSAWRMNSGASFSGARPRVPGLPLRWLGGGRAFSAWKFAA